MMEDQLDSLEDWVAVKHDPFSESNLPPKLLFIVGWNELEKKNCCDLPSAQSSCE